MRQLPPSSLAAAGALVLATLAASPAPHHVTTHRPVVARKATDVAIKTSDGTIVVRLEPARAPKTTANFLRYVDAHAYDGAEFYRVVSKALSPGAPFEVIQGGNEKRGGSKGAPIALEPTTQTKLHNDDGVIAMARTSDPDSATSEFFIDVGDARYLDGDGPLKPGYAAFGHVVSGMAVVRRIFGSPASGDQLTPPISIASMRRI